MRISRHGAPLFALLIGAWAFGSAGDAHGQRGIDAQLFRPAMDSYGIFAIERADTSHQWDFGFKLYGNFAGNPLRLDLADPVTPGMTRSAVLMDRQIALNFGVHLGLTNWLQLAIDIPVSSQNFTPDYGEHGRASLTNHPMGLAGDPVRSGFYQADGFTNIPPPDATNLDWRLGLKAKLFRKGLFGMAAAAIMTIPFGDDAHFLGDANFTFRPKVIVDITRGPVTAALNVGAVIRETTTVRDPRDVALRLADPRILISVGPELTYGAGVAYRFVHWVGLAAEFYGLIPLTKASYTTMVGGAPTQVDAPQDFTADVLGGLQFFPTRDLVLSVGAGAGVIPGAYRRDEYRAFLGMSWTPVEGGRGAVVVGGLDTDNDGVPDAQDLCPNEAEDRDGFDDEDGCPDLDNDQDGIPDSRDKCPNDPEDRDGFQDQDGCPETDNDNDGVPDAQDRCPNDAEDRDGFQDDDGCPDADNDGDGIPDVADKCPNEAETRNGVDDDDGCPDSGGQVVIVGGKIEIGEQVYFDAGKATIQARSNPLLDRIADKIRANPQVRRVRIEGHTDASEGKKSLALSQARAESVREYLIRKGIEGDRLQAVGYGDTRPIDAKKTAAARAKNRRVEFIIVEQ
jgi:outer membrane protein OmpA-like peptidoglycan-associated protein